MLQYFRKIPKQLQGTLDKQRIIPQPVWLSNHLTTLASTLDLATRLLKSIDNNKCTVALFLDLVTEYLIQLINTVLEKLEPYGIRELGYL